MSTVKKIFYSDIGLAGNSLLDARIDSKTTVERESIVLDETDSGRAVWDTDLNGLYVWEVDTWIRINATPTQINNWNQAYDDSVTDFSINQASNTVFTITRRNSTPLSATYKSGYVHYQSIPSAVWAVNHNLNKRASVVVVDSAENIVVGEVQYNSDNQITLTFAGAFSGKAYFN
jgi:hypothetical protein